MRNEVLENLEQVVDWQDEAMREVKRELEQSEERSKRLSAFMRALNFCDEMISEIQRLRDGVENKQHEIDDLNDDLEEKDAEINNIRRQLLEEKERRLTAESKLSELAMREASRMVIVTGNYNDVHDNGGVGMNSLKNQ